MWHLGTLTGTPITNTLTDLYGLLRFLRLEPWNDWDWFNNKIAKEQKDVQLAGLRAKKILQRHMLRRNKGDTLEGQPLIRLSPKTIELDELEFSRQERGIYTTVEHLAKQRMLELMERGEITKKYHAILTMILRLRQVCCHTHLIKGKYLGVESELAVVDAERARAEYKRAERVLGYAVVKKIVDFLMNRLTKAAVLSSMALSIDCCGLCDEPLDERAYITPCLHEICEACVDEVKIQRDGLDEDFDCPMCNETMPPSHLFLRIAFNRPTMIPTPHSQEDLARGSRGSIGSLRDIQLSDSDDDFLDNPFRKHGSRAKSKTETHPNTSSRPEDINKETLETPLQFMPAHSRSTKIIALLQLLHEWWDDAPNDRVIIYSQWTSFIDIVRPFLRTKGINSLEFNGKMSLIARSETIKEFKASNGPRVMFVSLKCGGVGLNLVRANRIVIMDLAWNWATEAQAIDRVHRLGQTKPVIVKRLIINDTIEERIIRLQAQKQELANAALGSESVGAPMRRLTEQDVVKLFNITEEEYRQAIATRKAYEDDSDF